ncbi:unnamed protein product [Moneuplotes crassus]|uniref:Uncharacterized protein n=1 Tax=Euplotes crassus TaxID=5936 RepID=A0AAD1X9G4_EUPCR|nr:unnamed protein product [Moneuplotes crassus]
MSYDQVLTCNFLNNSASVLNSLVKRQLNYLLSDDLFELKRIHPNYIYQNPKRELYKHPHFLDTICIISNHRTLTKSQKYEIFTKILLKISFKSPNLPNKILL